MQNQFSLNTSAMLRCHLHWRAGSEGATSFIYQNATKSSCKKDASHANTAVISCTTTSSGSTSDGPTASKALKATPPEKILWEAAINEGFASLDSKDTWRQVGYDNVVISPTGQAF